MCSVDTLWRMNNRVSNIQSGGTRTTMLHNLKRSKSILGMCSASSCVHTHSKWIQSWSFSKQPWTASMFGYNTGYSKRGSTWPCAVSDGSTQMWWEPDDLDLRFGNDSSSLGHVSITSQNSFVSIRLELKVNDSLQFSQRDESCEIRYGLLSIRFFEFSWR